MRQIDEKRKISQRVKDLLQEKPADHLTAIKELEPLILSDENTKGLIPVAMSKFVSDD